MERDILNILRGEDPEQQVSGAPEVLPEIDGYSDDASFDAAARPDGEAASGETASGETEPGTDEGDGERAPAGIAGGLFKKLSLKKPEKKPDEPEKPSKKPAETGKSGKKAAKKATKKNPEAAEDGDEASQELAARRDLYDWIQSLMVALMVCIAVFLFGVRVIDVSGSSMYPTLINGDKMLVSGLFYKPKAGDIVVFKTDSYDPNKALVKRVIATEGQEVSIDFDRGVVYIDGSPIEEDYIAELTKTKLDFIGPQTVPEGCVFCLGDNRNASTDSRKKEIGMVDTRMILGRTWCVAFPLADARLIG